MRSKQNSMARSGASTTSRISRDILSGVAVIGVVGIAFSTLFTPNLAQAQQRPPQAQPAQAQAQQQTARPNILVIFGDDVGQSNISAYSHGLVGYKTPSIDRIAKEGMMFTDYYAENSCTAGRSTFITGQVCLRTGLCKVGIPGATVGLQDRDITIAEMVLAELAGGVAQRLERLGDGYVAILQPNCSSGNANFAEASSQAHLTGDEC